MTSESAQVQQLRERYISSMPEKATMITEHIHVLLDQDSPNQETYDLIREDAHKLAGSLGMYGYNDIASVARNIMSIIDQGDAEQLQLELLNLRNLLRQLIKS